MLGVLLAHAFQLVDLAQHRLAHTLGKVAFLHLAAVVVGRALVGGAVEFAQLLLDGLELTAQQELALGLLHAFFDVGLDLLAQRQVRQRLTGPPEHQAQARLEVDGLEHFDLLGQRQVGRVARRGRRCSRHRSPRAGARPSGARHG